MLQKLKVFLTIKKLDKESLNSLFFINTQKNTTIKWCYSLFNNFINKI